MDIEEYKALTNQELIDRIDRARKEKNAVILAHNYQRIEVQHIADYCGDSLELSCIAAGTDADVVVFCGVDFMAESAKILAPEKTVLLPDIQATCPMAHMVEPEALRKAKEENPDALVLAYVNTTADVKALTDVCCTSANSVRVVKSIGDREILFVPDKNLAHYTQKITNADIIPWEGYCYVHNAFTVQDVERERVGHPDAVLIVHPECPPDVIAHADHVFSTSGMAKYVAEIKDESEKRRGVVIGTETGLVHRLQELHPDVGIWPLNPFAVCGTMKLTTLYKVCWSIETGNYEIRLSEEVIDKARASLEKMIEIV